MSDTEGDSCESTFEDSIDTTSDPGSLKEFIVDDEEENSVGSSESYKTSDTPPNSQESTNYESSDESESESSTDESEITIDETIIHTDKKPRLSAKKANDFFKEYTNHFFVDK